MRYLRGNRKKVTGIIVAAFAISFLLFWSNATQVQAATAKVTGASANIRSSASASSEVIASVKSGDKLDVISSETASDGYTWYKVYVSASSTGYIRADLVSTEGTISSSSSSTASTSTVTETEVTSITSKSASVSVDSATVRAQASTSANAVASLKSGAAVTLTGTATGTDGKNWYQVSFINNGSNVTGFIRADLVKEGEAAAPSDSASQSDESTETAGTATSETETAETTEAETSDDEDLAAIYGDIQEENTDYELKYTAAEDGTDTWYLYNNLEGVRLKLNDLLAVVTSNEDNMKVMNSKVTQLTVIVVILAVLLILAIGAAVIFGLKWHEATLEWEDDDEDQEEEDEDEEEEEVRRPIRKSRPVVKEEPKAPVRRAASKTEGVPVRRVARDADGNPIVRKVVRDADGNPVRRVVTPVGENTAGDRTVKSQEPVKRKAPVPDMNKTGKSDMTWKSKNFLTEDDDLDFSFINMDDDL